ncbi:hypothetical protein GCM10009657_20550 [Oryzihumus leptocrescens]
MTVSPSTLATPTPSCPPACLRERGVRGRLPRVPKVLSPATRAAPGHTLYPELLYLRLTARQTAVL